MPVPEALEPALEPARAGTLRPTRKHYPPMVLLAAAAMLALAGCGSSTHTSAASSGATNPGMTKARMTMNTDTDTDAPRPPQPPVTTTEADWKPVAETLGRTGTLMNGTVYRIPLPRTDLHVTSYGVAIKPGLALGGYATFTKYRDTIMLMGDMVVAETELPKVTDALQAAGIEQTALHKHLLEQSPAIWWTHFHSMGSDPTALAQGLKTALAATGMPPATPPPTTQPPINLDTAGIDKAIGRHGTADGGIYKFSIPRHDTITDGSGHVLMPATGITTAINFQPLGGQRAAINGDFVLTAAETQKVIQALRKGGIAIVELHNHSLDEQPRLFYLHFWATTDGLALARTLRTALDATNLTPPTP